MWEVCAICAGTHACPKGNGTEGDCEGLTILPNTANQYPAIHCTHSGMSLQMAFVHDTILLLQEP
jgi:hypothetical protein